ADAHSVADAQSQAAPAGVSDLKDRLTSYEKAIETQQEELKRVVGVQQNVERERSELVVRIGQRERALREEEELRRRADEDNRRLKGELDAARASLAEVQPARLTAALHELDRANDRARSLEQRAERAERLPELEVALAIAEKGALADKRAFERARDELEEQLRAAAAREEAALDKAHALREELKAARRALAGESEPVPSDGPARVGVFVDAANLSASARRDFGSKLDYRALLAEALDGRKKASAVAYVVRADSNASEERAHTGFVTSLREGGYEIREKRAKVRSDGSRKADWDMGIAMEILDSMAALDVVVLCSGDGDFVPLVQRLKREGKRVEVAAFRASTDDALIKAADAFTSLDGRFRLPT
ncbi:MAG TPA: NYN domain-containing protein, partial [Myxococcota bacterium]